jgi:WD40 repeat protein
VFRDDVSLSANPGLWSSIAQSLEASDYFVLLASPRAANSEWVAREVDHWLAGADARRLLIVLTEGELRWDRVHGDFDWSAHPPLPARLRAAFEEEPRYVDLRWVRGEEHLSLRNPRFREAVADLASAIRGRPKDELFGEDIRQHRRALRLARGGVSALALLAVVAVVLAVLAVQGRNRANAQAALATSRALAAEAEAAVQEGRLDVGLLLGAQSFASKPSPEARSALATALMASSHVQHVFHEEPVELATVSANGRRLAIVRREGPLVVWDLDARRTLGAPVPLPGRPVAIALSLEGRMLAISVAQLTSIPLKSGATNNQIPVVLVWDVDHRRFVLPASERQGPSIGASVPDVAVADNGAVVWSGGRPGLAEVDAWNGHRSGGGIPNLSCDVVINGDGSLVASVGSIGRIGQFATEVSVWRLGRSGLSEQPIATFSGRPGFAPGSAECGPRGSAQFDPARPNVLALGGWDGTVRLWDATTGAHMGSPLKGMRGAVSEISFSPDGDRLLACDEGGVTMWNLRERTTVPDFLSGAASDRGVWFGTNRNIVVTVGSAGTIALNDERARVLQLGSPIGTRATFTDAAFDPKTSILAIAETDGTIEFYDARRRSFRGRALASGLQSPHVVYSPDGRRLLAWADSGGRGVARVWDAESHRRHGRDIEDRGALGVSFAFTQSGNAVVSIRRDITDSTLVPLEPRGPNLDLRGSPDTQKARINAGRSQLLLETLWGTGVWDVRTGRLTSPVFPVGAAATTDDGRVVATGERDGTIELWDTRNGRRLTALKGSETPASLSFSPDGSLLAVYGRGLAIWDVPRRALLGRRSFYGGRPFLQGGESVAFSPSGRALVSPGFGGRPMLWNLDPRAWQLQACRLVGRRLSKTEWRDLVGSGPDAPAC